MKQREEREATTGENPFGTSTFDVFARAWFPAAVTCGLIVLTCAVPLIDSTSEPYIDLTGAFARIAYWFAESGGKFGAPIVAVAMVAALVARDGLTVSRRVFEGVVVMLVVAVFAAGGAALNEHALKPHLEIPRPNIVWLAGIGGAGPLGRSPEAFYAEAEGEGRRAVLGDALTREPRPVELSAEVEAHWISETGYSFPSGHAFSSMLIATVLLSLAVSYANTRRLWLFYGLLPWAFVVSCSRPLLRVHTTTDIIAGGVQGLLVGVVAAVICRFLMQRTD